MSVQKVDRPPTAVAVADEPSLRRTVVAASVGNFVEWYEFAVYGVVAAYISKAMFPTDDPTAAMLNTWAAYGVSFLVRPVGGVILARLGDRYGRRHILYVTITLMSVATFCVALIPSYATIGIAAPLLLISARIAQGIAAGGELAGAAAFLYEHAPADRRARMVSFLGVSTFCSIVLGSLLGTLLTVVLPAAEMQSWGWRVVFATALPLGFIGLYIRRSLQETPEFQQLHEQRDTTPVAPVPESFWRAMRENGRAILLYLGFGTFYSIAVYVSVAAYLAFMLANGFSEKEALTINTVAGLAIIAGILLTGGLADRVGRKPILVAGAGAMAVGVVPTFLLGSTGTFALGLLGALIFALPLSVFITPAVINVVELFPAKVRVTAGAAAYNLTVIIGGFMPFVAVWLTDATGSHLAFPAFVATTAVVALAVVLVWYREPAADQASTQLGNESRR
ncbi:L-Proline/Glycine betaine transporter ProP [Pimelobacter simplex]|uniref:Putative proline/betaine transporter n=1 Tax=Nocardioides simplex TaxID=2045 RepID=A0A0C5WZQ3_NOCSI|nr:L-Proline/Glycine betaine transporter ProP [Pimelobacter simplex]SFM19496.1 MFS transporter, MHS family, proline/betaine transporter [Pimelobacter simplex]